MRLLAECSRCAFAALALVAGALAESPATADQYLLLNYSASPQNPGQSAEIMGYVQRKFGAANRASALKVGVAVIYTPRDQVPEYLALMKEDLALARRLDVPILVQVDTENWLPDSLLNWYDPAKPGYDPAKVADVEWTGWSPTGAVKLCWRNWGTQVRIGPQPNLLSPRFQAWEKSIYDAFLPPVIEWYHALPDAQKGLLVGWKCGWETTLNSQYRYFVDGNSYYGRKDDPKWAQAEAQILGYNAAQTAGIQTSGVLDYQSTYDVFMKIQGRHLAYLAKMACDRGIPRAKVFTHSIAQGVDRYNEELLVNPYSNPGVSFYGKGSLKSNASFMRAVQAARERCGAAGYGIGEFNLNTTEYAPWLNWLKENLRGDPDCVFQALYNYDSMMGKPAVEQAMLDAMALYPAAGPAGAAPTPKARKPMVFAAYYIWYRTGEDAKRPWSHWTYDAVTKLNGDANPLGKPGDPPLAPSAYPLAGLYSSTDAAVAAWHMQVAKAAGIDALLVSWWGRNNETDVAFEGTTLPAAEKAGMKVALLDELAQFHNDDAVYQAGLAAALRKFKESPAYLRIDGRPVVYLYQVAQNPGLTPESFARVRDSVEREVGPVYWIVDKLAHDHQAQTPDQVKCIPPEWLGVKGIDSFAFYSTFSHFRAHTYDELAGKFRYLVGLAHGAGKKMILPVHPGHNNSRFSTQPYEMPRRDGQTFRDYLKAAEDAGADGILVTSWNEWPETTVIEPSSTWPDPYQYVKILAEWKGVPFVQPAAPPSGGGAR